jgi:hypothetical protein
MLPQLSATSPEPLANLSQSARLRVAFLPSVTA